MPGNTLTISLVVVSALLIMLMLIDRLAQVFKKPPGGYFDTLQLLTALAGIVLHALYVADIKWAVAFFAIILVVPLCIEIIGHKTGIPFGRYRYTEKAGPVIPFSGGIPVSVIMMWWGLMYVGMNAAVIFADLTGYSNNRIIITVSTAVLITIWDLIADPVAVNAGMWEWKKRGIWFGIPVTNFFGWLLVTILTVSIVFIFTGTYPQMTVSTSHYLYAIPTLLFGLLNLDYAGAAKTRKLSGLLILGVFYGLLILLLYVLFVTRA